MAKTFHHQETRTDPFTTERLERSIEGSQGRSVHSRFASGPVAPSVHNTLVLGLVSCNGETFTTPFHKHRASRATRSGFEHSVILQL